MHFCILSGTGDGTRLIRGKDGGHDRPCERKHTFRMGRRVPTQWNQSHVCGPTLKDAIFVSNNLVVSIRYAEMDPAYKNTLSHRYKALNMLVGYLKHTTI